MKPRYHYNNTPLRRVSSILDAINQKELAKWKKEHAMDKLINDILKLMRPGKPLLIILPKFDGPQN